MTSPIFWMIVGMGIVTYIPRMLPFVLIRGKELPPFIQGVLKNVPYATLGALIFPAIFFIQEELWFGVVGAISAFAIAFIGVNVIVVVIGTVAVLSIFSLF
ncbi:branched-subunit amino acid transport protein [Bacillus oleivorans]|uniref:Branched-subunit amino acid transport protein n=1 Tax=Bacillus oleivorans TaxID=1448271 RepID=A0A285CR83_9BACI|nr:AzlD domain-containing protein [Bacillus oleivorans]SNX70041.1 branched-subunit amino acid transport protein [Bacillus oleivorans]